MNRAFSILKNSATSMTTTVSATVPMSMSNSTIPTNHFDVDQREQNIVSAINNKFKKEDRLSGKLEKI